MEQGKTINIKDIFKILRRRRWGLLVPALAIFILSAVVALVVEPVYRSTSTILIEEQEIPREYVMATVTSYAEQRLQAITQRIMSTARLLELVNRFNLYAEKRKSWTTEQIIENMRKKDIKFETISADVLDRRTGSASKATIAFAVSFEGKSPQMVQQIANVLASFYMEENLKVVGQQTEGAKKFLEDEMNSVRANLSELERRIASYKERNPSALPELLQFNLQSLDWSERSHNQLTDQLRSYREKESYLQTQLATTPPDSKNNDKERLRELRLALVSLEARYSPEYPDVIKTRAEIAKLEEKLQLQGTKADEKPDNTTYMALSAELASVQSEIKSVKQQIEEVDRKRNEYKQRLEMSPRVEEGYRNLMAERNNTQLKYDDLMKKYMEAKVARGLEKEQMGERFTLIDPARLPEKPVRPNRPAILLIGLILGIGAGVGTASLQEAADHSARRSEDLSTVFRVLAGIPEIVTREDELRNKRRMKMAAGIVVILVIGLFLGIHFLVMDLNVLWARAVRRLAF